MIGLPRGVSVFAFDEPCDMRKSFDTLTALVVEHMRHDVLAGDVYLFVSRVRIPDALERPFRRHLNADSGRT